jgi:transposase-like protein
MTAPERQVPFYCPYCADEDLRPSEAGHGTWECRACMRAFSLKFVGLLSRSTDSPRAVSS